MHELFVLSLTCSLALLFAWAFRTLPQEGWQIMASVPVVRSVTGSWIGVNFTYYGLILASATVLGFVTYLLLMGSLGVSFGIALGVAGILVLGCLPAARWVAYLVEGRRTTLTVAGALFVGVLVAPIALWLSVWAFGRGDESVKALLIPCMASLAVAAVLGEGSGRLACISFGCCYGRPLQDFSPWVRRLFKPFNMMFQGSTKKIAYDSGLEGVAVMPVQALTAVMLSTLGLVGLYLFLEGWFATALLVAVIGSQVWRIFSETLRADDRGPGRFTFYQQLSLVVIFFVVVLAWLYPTSRGAGADLVAGLYALWNPLVILCGQLLWMVVFVYCGRSVVTASVISLHVVDDS